MHSWTRFLRPRYRNTNGERDLRCLNLKFSATSNFWISWFQNNTQYADHGSKCMIFKIWSINSHNKQNWWIHPRWAHHPLHILLNQGRIIGRSLNITRMNWLPKSLLKIFKSKKSRFQDRKEESKIMTKGST